MASPYPTAFQIEEIFDSRHHPNIFNTYLADNVEMSVVGQDSHTSGHYNTTQAIHDEIYARIVDALKAETIRLEVVRLVGGGESSWAAVETLATAESKSGKAWRHEWVDLVRFNSQGKIARLKEFFDSQHVHSHIEENESKDQK